jgi:HD superfamily phosphohydrolase YqeK
VSGGRDDGLPSWATVTPARAAHVERVASLATGWAEALSVPAEERRRWLRAVWLHDAFRDADDATLSRWAPDASGSRELLHGPASAARAASEGETDQGVLDAVRYHSIGYAGWDMAGRVLYCADYLEPGRDHAREHRAELARRFPADPSGVLLAVATDRLTHLIRSRWPLIEPTVRFWNHLVASSGPR